MQTPLRAAGPLRVLVVARWYPSHDQPGRGSFVADLVAALLALPGTPVEVTVASFEATHVRGVAATRPERGRRAAELMGQALAGAASINRPRSWGVPGVQVARLPVYLDGERRRPTDIADAHAAALLPFAAALFARWPFEVIHAHTGLVDGVVAVQVADALGGVPVLVTEHSSTAADELTDPEAAGLYLGLVGAGAGAGVGPGRRRLVAVSASLAAAVAGALGIDTHAIQVLPNAVPIAAFPFAGADGRRPGELLYVGARKTSKGMERLLRAFAIARAAGAMPGATPGATLGATPTDLRLRLIGSAGTPDEEAEWRRLAAELDVADAVSFEGPAARADVAAAMRQAALFVHPSPRETFGMVVAEALASGLPVVATPAGGSDEIVGSDGRYGIVAAGMEPEALAAAITTGLDRADAFDRAGMRAHVERTCAAPSVAGRTVELYGELTAAAADKGGTGRGPGPMPASGPDNRPAVVVALARGQAVGRFNLLPPVLRSKTAVVTLPAAPTGLNAAPLPQDGTWLEFDPDRALRDALAAFGEPRQVRGGPLGLLDEAHNRRVRDERTRVEAQRDELLAEGVRASLRDPIGGNGWLVTLDADDVLTVQPALGTGVDLAPGALRWLTDRDDEAANPA